MDSTHICDGVMNRDHRIDNVDQISRLCYYAGLVFAFTGLIGILLLAVLQIPISQVIPPCAFHSVTGYYCPGCGGTRAVIAMLHGRIFSSLCYHPFVVYMTAYYIVFEISHTLDIITGHRIRGLRICPVYFYVGIALIIIQCIVKNILKYRYGISL